MGTTAQLVLCGPQLLAQLAITAELGRCQLPPTKVPMLMCAQQAIIVRREVQSQLPVHQAPTAIVQALDPSQIVPAVIQVSVALLL